MSGTTQAKPGCKAPRGRGAVVSSAPGGAIGAAPTSAAGGERVPAKRLTPVALPTLAGIYHNMAGEHLFEVPHVGTGGRGLATSPAAGVCGSVYGWRSTSLTSGSQGEGNREKNPQRRPGDHRQPDHLQSLEDERRRRCPDPMAHGREAGAASLPARIHHRRLTTQGMPRSIRRDRGDPPVERARTCNSSRRGRLRRSRRNRYTRWSARRSVRSPWRG